MFLFGDANNVRRLMVKFFLGLITIWKIWSNCSMLDVGYFMGRKIKHCWLVTNLVKHFKIWNGVVLLWSPLGVNCYQIIRCNCWSWHLICGQSQLNYFQRAQFEIIMMFWSSILNLFLVLHKKFLGSCDNGDPINA